MNICASQNQSHASFEHIATQSISRLGLTLFQYRHKVTGALHYHFSGESTENTFMLALRTPPADATGAFHVLEHLITCGSEKFPLHNLFFRMTQRSVYTFMNAFTGSDWTAFPFASRNKADFNNLLQVFLDAVFFSRLDPLDFAQEGHRLEFSDPSCTDSELQRNGVVLNEMKGAMTSPEQSIWAILCQHLFPNSPYQYNAGGDPAHITSLSHEQLLRIYKKYYHPGNAIFMTMGDIPAFEHQTHFESLVLHRFHTPDNTITVPPTNRFSIPKALDQAYPGTPALEQDNGFPEGQILVAWLLGESASIDDLLEADLLSQILLEAHSSPINQAFQGSALQGTLSEFCGVHTDNKEICFIIGLDQADSHNAAAVEECILNSLQALATTGVTTEAINNALERIALARREPDDDFLPLSVKLLLSVLPAAIHRQPLAPLLEVESALGRLRKKLDDPGYLSTLLYKRLLDNTHRLRISLSPDAQMLEQACQRESEDLCSLKGRLSHNQKQQLLQLHKALQQRQSAIGCDDLLPVLSLQDIASDAPTPQCTRHNAGIPLTHYPINSDGIAYQQLVFEIPALAPQQLRHLKLLARLVDYAASVAGQDKNNKRHLVTIQTQVTAAKNACNANEKITSNSVLFSITGRALTIHQEWICTAILDSINHLLLDNTELLQACINETSAALEQNLFHGGHMLAMSAACADFNYCESLAHLWHGLGAITHSHLLLNNNNTHNTLSAELKQLHDTLLSAPKQVMAIGADPAIQWERWVAGQNQHAVQAAVQTTHSSASPPNPVDVLHSKGQLWLTPQPVSFCAMAFPTVDLTHEDCATLAVIGNLLHNGFLNRVLREEGGAYGAGASQESSIGAFRMFSSYTPNVDTALNSFQRSLTWLIETDHTQSQIDQAIVRTVAALDRFNSPIAEIKQNFMDTLLGHTPAIKSRYRQALLTVNCEKIHATAVRYFTNAKARTAVITDASNRHLAEQFNLITHSL